MNNLTDYADKYRKENVSAVCHKKYCYRIKEETVEKLKRQTERCVIWKKVIDN